MTKGRAIQINDKGVRPLLDQPCNIHVPKESLEQLQLALAAHIVTRPENLDPALPAWVERKEELKRGIDLHLAALPPKVVIVQAPPKPKPEPKPKETPMPWPAGKKKPPMSEETKQKIRDARAAQLAKKAAEAPSHTSIHAPDQAAQLRAQVLLAGYTAEVREIRARIWRLMASLEACNQVTKDALAADLALLDAAAHAAHQLALGRLEVA